MQRTLANGSLALVVLALGACDKRLSIGALTRDENNTSTREAGALPPGDGGRDADANLAGSDGSVDVCERTGPLLNVGDGAGPACSNGATARAFRYVACSCDDLVSSSSLITDAFDTAKQASRLANGSVGINRNFYPTSAAIAGSLVVAGADGIPARGGLTIGGDLRDQGLFDGQFDMSVGGDAEVGGDVRVKSLSLGGMLTVNASSTVDITDGNPPFAVASVNVSPPCDCDNGPDLPALVLAAQNDNDNAAIGLDPKDGLRSLNAAIELTLPCGRYYVDELYAPKPITLTITGRVALYVSGDLVTEVGGALRFQLAPGAELDLVIAQNASAADLFELGSAVTAGRARLYAGGARSLVFAGNTTISGTLYAPKAELVTSSTFEIFGAVLARRMSTSGALKLHYDRKLADGSCAL